MWVDAGRTPGREAFEGTIATRLIRDSTGRPLYEAPPDTRRLERVADSTRGPYYAVRGGSVGRRASNPLEMKILFVMRHPGFVRNFEWVIRELNRRGHQVHLGFERDWGADDDEIIARILGDYEHVTCGRVPKRADHWVSLASDLRQAISFLRYLRPEYQRANKLRARAEKKAPAAVVRLSQAPFVGTPVGLRLLGGSLRTLESALPRARAIDRYLKRGAFDLLMTTPLVVDTTGVDWIRSARFARVPTAFPVASWDNLTLKGVVLEAPDRTYVWNEIQRDEAGKYHRIRPETVAVVGAHSFDHWFTWTPSTSRAEFCQRVGLNPPEPFILYVCSSALISPDERPLVTRWIDAIRSHEALRGVGVLVRPHLQGTNWIDNPLADYPNAVVWPIAGENPFHTGRRNGYYDSIYHASAVVGINTTALIEAAIVGRRTFTYTAEEAYGGQEGTLHFHYLVKDNGGALTVGHSLHEHAEHLAQALSSTQESDPWRERFLASFVRPRGLNRQAAPDLVDDLESFVAEFTPAKRGLPHPIRYAALVVLRLTTSDRRVRARWAKDNRVWRREKAGEVRHWMVVQRARARTVRKRLTELLSTSARSS
jgi:hypothetical protein